MIQYKDLNLKEIREKANLDFAHYTYKKGMCSCCYGPKDLPKRYWKNNMISEDNNYTYILFKNANNGSGAVTKNHFIKKYTYISWRMNQEQLDLVCNLLLEQLDEDYVIVKPQSKHECILILEKQYLKEHIIKNPESIYLEKENLK